MEITYDQGSEFIGHEFRKSLLETEYGITAKPSKLVNPTSNIILERICQVLGNLVAGDDPWTVILAAADFTINSTKNRLKGYNPGQLVFGRDIILPITHKADW